MISVGYFFVACHVFQAELTSILDSQADFIFTGGLRRMISVNSFFWSREAYLNDVDDSLVSFLHNDFPFPDPSLKLEAVLKDYGDINHYLKFGEGKKFYDDRMVEIEMGSPCKHINAEISNCSSTKIRMGISSGIFNYIEEMRSVVLYD